MSCNQGICQAGNTATQNIYNHFATNPLNASYGIYSMDILCNPGCGGLPIVTMPASTAPWVRRLLSALPAITPDNSSCAIP